MNLNDLTDTPWFKKVILYFLHNGWLIALAFLLASLSHYQIKQHFMQDHTLRIPVQIEISHNRIPVDDTIRYVVLTLKGSKQKIKKIDPADVSIVLRTGDALFDKQQKTYFWRLSKDNVKVPFGIQIQDIKPRQLMMNMDTNKDGKIPVEAVFEGRLPQGYKLGKVTVVPKDIQVIAPEEKLKTVKKILTKPIPLSEISHSFDCDQTLDLAKYPKFQFGQNKVMVQVEVVFAFHQRVFRNLPVRIITSTTAKQPLNCRIISAPNVDITISGVKNIIENIRPEELMPFVDISQFDKPGNYDLDIHCVSEVKDIQIKTLFPKRITVQLTPNTVK